MEIPISPEDDSFSATKKTLFILIFFLITPVALATSFISLATFSQDQPLANNKGGQLYSKSTGAQVFASLPNSFPSVSGEVESGNAKVGRIKIFLENNKSQLTPYASFIVETAEKYGLDYRLTTAIAQKESGSCRAIPEGSNNCWGWGIHSAGTLMFDNLGEGIDSVSKGLKEYYLDEGYQTVEEIMSKYAHPSSTTWAQDVLEYMNQIEDGT